MFNFIYQEYISELSLCDELIEYHSQSEKHRGYVLAKDGSLEIDLNTKDSFDVNLADDSLAIDYFGDLNKIILSYIEKYPYCASGNQWSLVEPVVIQHYSPGGGFKKWHTERNGFGLNNLKRHLVFMTYLNDVTDEGGTEFLHQNKVFTPKKGLTLIWPADWTHTHRGVVSPSQDKYIITGWLSFI